jgi:hypothetical protein
LRRADRRDPDRPRATSGSTQRLPSRCRREPRRSRVPQANAPNTGSTAAATGSSATRCRSSRSPARSTTPATKEYLARKEAEGKTKKGALRSLKRHLARRFHRLLSEPPADQHASKPDANEREHLAGAGELPAIPPPPSPHRPTDPNIKGLAPFPMACIS